MDFRGYHLTPYEPSNGYSHFLRETTVYYQPTTPKYRLQRDFNFNFLLDIKLFLTDTIRFAVVNILVVPFSCRIQVIFRKLTYLIIAVTVSNPSAASNLKIEKDRHVS